MADPEIQAVPLAAGTWLKPYSSALAIGVSSGMRLSAKSYPTFRRGYPLFSALFRACFR